MQEALHKSNVTEVELGGALMRVEGDAPPHRVVLFLPGISGQVMSVRFDPVVAMVHEAGWTIARLEIWKDAEDANTKTIREIHEAVSAALSELKDEGYERIVAVGKSFGGGILLSLQDPRIDMKVLWAPAMSCGEESNLDVMGETQLSNIEKLLDIKIACDAIVDDPAEIVIIHGTEDSIIPIENSEMIMELRGAMVVAIEGADHSFKIKAHEDALLEATKAVLNTLT